MIEHLAPSMGPGDLMRIADRRREEWSLRSPEFDSMDSVGGLRGRGDQVIRWGKGEPIVLVPGLAGGRALVAPLARRLANHFEVILPALRGDRGLLGDSPPRELGELADDLAATIDRLGIERPTLLGVSFGGAVALEYAVEYPDRIGGLAIWGAEATFRPSLGTNIARRALERFPMPSDSRFLNQFFNILHGGKPEPGPLTDFIVESCWRTDQAVVAYRIGLLETFDVADRLWRLDAPTLVMAGTRDVVVPPSSQRALAGSIAGAGFVQVEGAGHVGFLTHRHEVAAHLGAFVRRVRRSYCGPG